MKNSIGRSIILTLFGESHGPYIGAVLDGMTPGIPVDETFIQEQLSKRRPKGIIDTTRIEQDHFQIISGVFQGYTTGSPICILISNENLKSSDYEKNKGIARPSHADYTAHVKFLGFEDYRGGGHFSGRLTAPIVAMGAICLKALENLNIAIGTHILKCGNVEDDSFCNIEQEISSIHQKEIPVIKDIEEEIEQEMMKAKRAKDSIGGIIQTAIWNLPAGIGEPWFDSLEGALANALLSIGGIKGIEFGSGFDFANMKGSTANDSFCYQDGKVVTTTNHNGGINGGISNGMPIIFNACVKPTPSIGMPQDTINYLKQENTKLEIIGRHDPAIIKRICIVVTSLVAIVTCDMLAYHFGTNIFKSYQSKERNENK